MSLPEFSEFFAAVHGHEPFPWQRRLASQVIRGSWTSVPLLDLPTGAGKTAALDVALWALAAAPARMPRRTVLVVDRRIVVDEAAERARRILKALEGARGGVLRTMADALRAVPGEPAGAPFVVSVMRGGMPRDDDWARAPDVPVVALSTVDQIGSRLLFRGYGVGPRSASIHAGLLGNDTLVLLDEVHLAEPFAQTLEACRMLRSNEKLPNRFAVVRMSATAGAMAGRPRFTLDDEDMRHPVLRARLSATKEACLVPVKVTGDDEGHKLALVADAAVRHAVEFQEAGARIVGIVLNRVEAARRARETLEAHHTSTDAMLMTGRMRPVDRDVTVGELVERAGPRDRSRPARPLIVVATQCLEAGADLDFDALVTECASLDALRQRFGRLDRRGELRKTRAVILGRSDQVSKDDDPIYSAALGRTWRWLLDRAGKDGVVDFGIEALSPDDSLNAPREDAPVLLPAHLDAWAQTSPWPDFEPDTSLWLHGPRKSGADVQIIFRGDLILPEAPGASVLEVTERLLAARPSSLESLSVPIAAARRWLAKVASSAIADVMAGDTAPDDSRIDGETVVALRWRGEDSAWVTVQDVRPGDTLVVPAQHGGIRERTFAPESSDPVFDVGDLASLRARAVVQLRLGPTPLEVWGVRGDAPVPGPEETNRELRARVADWASALPEARPEGSLATECEWRVFREALMQARAQVTRLGAQSAVLTVRLPPNVLRGEVTESTTEDDDSSFITRDVSLQQHSADVRTVVGRLARALHLPSTIADDLALAAWLHDTGKADQRFQRWLVGGSEVAAAALEEPLAKSRFPAGSPAERRSAQIRAGYPQGYRHELLSVALATTDRDLLAKANDEDLVLHLVASHHGFARPFGPFHDHPDDIPVSLNHGGARLEGSTRHRLGNLGSPIPVRFQRVQARYGWWGLAWLEAILRLADHHASRVREEGKTP